MSEELFERFKAVPRAKLLIEQLKDTPLDDKSMGFSFLLSLACNVQLDIHAMHLIYNDLAKAASPYMKEDDFNEVVEAVAQRMLKDIRELAEDHLINCEDAFDEGVEAVDLQMLKDVRELAEDRLIDHELDNMVKDLQAMLGREQADE